MLRIRLRRIGKKGRPHYRVVVADQRDKRDGRFLENLGSYDPHAEPPTADLDQDKAREWLSKGAQPSESVAKIFRRIGVIEGGPVQRPMVAPEAGPDTISTEAAAAAAQAADVVEAVMASSAGAQPETVAAEAAAAAEDVEAAQEAAAEPESSEDQ